MTNLDSILKCRDISLPTKVRLVKAMVFPVVMNGCESWTIKKAEQWRIDAFELWFWRRLLRVPWTARRANQSILKEISPEYSLEGLMLKLKLQYFGHLLWRTDSKRPWFWERLRAGGEGDDRGWDGWMASLTQRTWVWVNSGSWWWTGRPGMLQSVGSQRVWRNWMTGGSDDKEFACNVTDEGSIPGSEKSPGEGNGNPLQYSLQKNSMDRGAWWATVYGVIKSGTRLSNWHFYFHSILSTGFLALPIVFALGLTIRIFNESQSTFKYC